MHEKNDQTVHTHAAHNMLVLSLTKLTFADSA